MADRVLGYGTYAAAPAGAGLVTSRLDVAFVGHAAAGEWVFGSAEVLRVGSRLAHAQCLLTAGGRPIAAASASFAVTALR
jgi:acyl-coenzyme A thioesterase PaaI-like protein